jgi:hypothetical protein
MTDTRPKPDDPAQSRRFIDMAREVEADDNEGAMDKALKRVARITPTPLDDKKDSLKSR